MAVLEPIGWMLTNDPEDTDTHLAHAATVDGVEVRFDSQGHKEAIIQGRNLLGEGLSRPRGEDVLMYEHPTSILIHESKSQGNRRRIDMATLPPTLSRSRTPSSL